MFSVDQYPFTSMKRIILDSRGLGAPDGRNLYQYRLSVDEFNALEVFLHEKIDAAASMKWTTTRSGFPELFVLYASEWWRRRYDGSGFTWEPILAALGIDAGEWHPADRSECVRVGLRAWGLDLLQNSGFRFLGAVAVQGGLPIKVLAEAHGPIGRVVLRVLRMARLGTVTKQNLSSWVESLQSILPISYRQQAIFALLADIAWTIIQLKQLLDDSADPIAKLDRSSPGWRDLFPLPLEERDARTLVENLVREAARIKLQKSLVALPVERTLELASDGSWALRSRIDLPATIDFATVTTLFGVAEADLPQFAELQLEVGGRIRSTTLRKMIGLGSYRVARTPWGFSHAAACDEHLLRLTASDGRTWIAPAPKGFELDSGLPWLFVRDGENFRFWCQGSGGVPADEAAVFISPDWSSEHNESSGSLTDKGFCGDPERNLLQFSGQVSVTNRTGTYKLRTNQPSEEEGYEWKGDRVWLTSSSPRMIFQGLPTVYATTYDGSARRLPGELGATVIGNSLSGAKIGPMMLQYPASGPRRCRTRAVVISPEAKLAFAGISASSGFIDFLRWGIAHAEAVTPGVELRCSSLDGGYRVEVTAPDGKPPAQLGLRVFWSKTTTPAALTLPFPAQGARLVDGNDQPLSSVGARIAVQRLSGCRLIVVGTAQQQIRTLRLQAMGTEIRRTFPINYCPGSFSTEIRLADYRSDIEHLLTIDDDPDSTVMLSAGTADRELVSLIITPHQGDIERVDGVLRVHLGNNALPEPPSARMLRLESPGDEPFALETPGGGTAGEWAVDFEALRHGTWLVYPPAGSSFAFRPTAYGAGEPESEPESEFAAAIGITNKVERCQRIDALIESMALNLAHPSWIDVEQLASQTGHLPLATFDLWRRFARSSRAMASLMFRPGNLSFPFLERFGTELPFSWETVAYRDWKAAAEAFRAYCIATFDDGEKIFTLLFRDRIEEVIACSDNSLFYLMNVLRSQVISEWVGEVAMLRAAGKQELLRGQHGPLNRLRCSHPDNEEWPTGFGPLLRKCRSDQVFRHYMVEEHLGFQDGVINVPLFLAAQVAAGDVSCWFEERANVHLLRNVRAFDPEWFETAYNRTIQRCLANGLLD